ncbi:transcriptional regulator NrdR [Geothrix fermentans]|jgi:transcriptional repressor NrdR|uniref:transcriptional regulator NrdR n=1 Tax=Geothrix fermentans TaxID=44676 RepID=UPI0004239B2A|nr:transcriptional regulator NrdR [Geothrix fermentans]
MRCPFCGHLEDKVVDSRESREGDSIRRRRECLSCARRFTSYERVEEVPLVILKKDGRREPFDRQKLMKGLLLACQKRPVSLARIEELVADVQARLMERPDREIRSRELGELIMDELKALDQVAYVRFASVYRDFKDLPDFVKALEGLMHKEAQKEAPQGSGSGPGSGPESGQGRAALAKPQPQALFPAEAEAPVLRTRKK